MICSRLVALAMGLSVGRLARRTQYVTFPGPRVPQGCRKEEARRGWSWEVLGWLQTHWI